MKPPIKSLVFYGIQYFGKLIFILAAALCLYSFGLKSMVLVECAYIIYWSVEYFFFWPASKIRTKLKNIFSYTSPGLVIIIIVTIVGIYIDDPTTKDLIDLVMRIVAGIFAIPLIIPIFSYERCRRSMISGLQVPSKLRITYNVIVILYHILVPLGIALTIFSVLVPVGFYIQIISIIGCILWACQISLTLYCWWNCDIIPEQERASDGKTEDNESGDFDKANSKADNGERGLSEIDVKHVVKKIADRWCYKEEPTSLLSEGVGTINYHATVEIIGWDMIKYTLSGKLRGVREGKESDAYSYASMKLDKAAYKIQEETRRALENEKLPCSYEVSVEMGGIE